MGGGISSCSTGEIKCPKNYDKEKFQKILMLYDKLDTNGNMGNGTRRILCVSKSSY